jgi:hypothetical protein
MEASVTTCLISHKHKVAQAIALVAAKLGKEQVKSRLWYRTTTTNRWTLADPPIRTMEEFGLVSGDKLLLEILTKGSLPQQG